MKGLDQWLDSEADMLGYVVAVNVILLAIIAALLIA